MASLQTAQLVVGTSPVELTAAAAATDPSHSLIVRAPDSATLWIGPAGVTPATGFPVDAGTSFPADLTRGERLYGVLAAGSGTVYVLRSSVTA